MGSGVLVKESVVDLMNLSSWLRVRELCRVSSGLKLGTLHPSAGANVLYFMGYNENHDFCRKYNIN